MTNKTSGIIVCCYVGRVLRKNITYDLINRIIALLFQSVIYNCKCLFSSASLSCCTENSIVCSCIMLQPLCNVLISAIRLILLYSICFKITSQKAKFMHFIQIKHYIFYILSSAPIALRASRTFFIALSACSSVSVPSCERIEMEYETDFLPFSICSPL